MRTWMAFAGAVTMALAVPASAEPADVAAAVANTGARTEANVKLDEGRKPTEVLQFFGLQQGAHVLDLFGANKYWAEITAPAVGPAGRITVWNPTQFLNEKNRAAFAEFASKHSNVMLLASPMEDPKLGTDAYDFAMMNLDYHDVYWESSQFKIVRMEPDAWLKALYAAVKPGGTVAIIDHAANPGGNTREVVDKLHRIDPAVIRADFERAGFVFEAESDILRNPADDRTLLVFDPKIRGKTDRVMYRFRKPAA